MEARRIAPFPIWLIIKLCSAAAARCLRKTPLFRQLFLCLSRACLGKMIVFSIKKRLHERRFSHRFISTPTTCEKYGASATVLWANPQCSSSSEPRITPPPPPPSLPPHAAGAMRARHVSHSHSNDLHAHADTQTDLSDRQGAAHLTYTIYRTV